MRILTGVVVLALGFSIGCAGRTSTTTGGGGGAATTAGGGGAATTAGGGAATAAQARMTEADYDAIMKKVGPTNGGMRKAIMSNQLADAGKNAQQLAMLFGDAERFWTQYKIMDAAKLAREARMFATETAEAAAAGDQMKTQMAADSLLGQCKQCHGMYRAGSQEAGFMIKAGVLGAE
jgi:cytochrome c556